MDLLHGGGEVQRPESYESVAPREERGAEGSDSWQERAYTPSELAGVHGKRLRELMRPARDINAHSLPGIAYSARSGTSPEMERSTLTNVYRFILDCHAKKMAAELAPGSDGSNDTAMVRNMEGGGSCRAATR
jgi:hypothetical protein